MTLRDSTVATRLPAQDLDRARAFYAEKLGLDPVDERPGGLLYRVSSGEFALFLSAGRASGAHTQIAFEVADLEATVAELRARGVVFEALAATQGLGPFEVRTESQLHRALERPGRRLRERRVRECRARGVSDQDRWRILVEAVLLLHEMREALQARGRVDARTGCAAGRRLSMFAPAPSSTKTPTPGN